MWLSRIRRFWSYSGSERKQEKTFRVCRTRGIISDMNDTELLQRCLRADKEAWNQFVDTYSRLVYNYIYCTFKIKGTNLPEQDRVSDIFQEIFLSLVKDNFRKLRSFRGRNGCSLASWLRQVVINATLDYMRRERLIDFARELDGEDSDSLSDILTNEFSSADSKAEVKEKFSGLTDCIQGLDTDEKYFLELHISMGLSLEELREHLKITRGAIDMRKARIVNRLKDCFRNKGLLV